MKKTLILFCTIILLCGCAKDKEQIKKESEETKNNIEETRNNIVVGEIKNLLANTNNSNYSYDYKIRHNFEDYQITGSKYINIMKGKITSSNYNIDFQYEDEKYYKLDNKEEIENPFKDFASYINIDFYIKMIENNMACETIKDKAICNNLKDNSKISFILGDSYIEKIIYHKDNNSYELTYSNFNDIEFLPKLNYTSLNISYNKTNKIKQKEKINEDGSKYKFYYYYVDNITLNINGEKVSVENCEEIFNGGMYVKQYYNDSTTTQLIFDNDFTLIYKENDYYYFTTLNYTKEILNKIGIDDNQYAEY